MILTLNNVPSAPVTVAPGTIGYVPINRATPATTEAVLTDMTGGSELARVVLRFCTTRVAISVTIKANTTYRQPTLAGILTAPQPEHGVVRAVGTGPVALTYTPDPCFSGTDRYGFQDPIAAEVGTVTGTVLPGACGITVQRTGFDCTAGTVSYSATNPYALPALINWSGGLGASDTSSATVPANGTFGLLAQHYAANARTGDRVTFRAGDPSRVLLVDNVTFVCPVAAGGGDALAATGSQARTVGLTAGLMLMLGLGLVAVGRRRV